MSPLSPAKPKKKEPAPVIYFVSPKHRFEMRWDFIKQYVGKEPAWGPVGKVAYVRTYARELRGAELVRHLMRDMGMDKKQAASEARTMKMRREEFWQTARRVVEFVQTVFKQTAMVGHHPWDEAEAHEKAEEMFRRLWAFKWLPPGRGLQFAGTPVVELKGAGVLNNCGFSSTKNIGKIGTFSEPFTIIMDFLMLGVGMGSDVQGAGKFIVKEPMDGFDVHVVGDSREGWVEAFRVKLKAYAGEGYMPIGFDTSKVRGEGKVLKTFGGTASGPGPLIRLLNAVDTILRPLIGKPITATAIADLINNIGVCVVAGNIRRSAEILIGEHGDEEFAKLKDPTLVRALEQQQRDREAQIFKVASVNNRLTKLWAKQVGKSAASPEFLAAQDTIDSLLKYKKKQLQADAEWSALQKEIDQHPLYTHRWASNNTILCARGANFDDIGQQIATNGEPGVAFMDNIRAYGRMNDDTSQIPHPSKWLDANVEGFNPCQPGWATVLTPEGVRTFDDISEGSIIWSGKEWTRVSKKWCTGVKPVFAVRTAAGTFFGTAEHRVVSEGVKIEAQHADSIDISVGPVAVAEAIDPQSTLDGLMLGDGYYEAKREQNLLIEGSKDGDYLNSEIGSLLGERVPASYGHEGTTLWAAHTTLRGPLPKTYDRDIPVEYLRGTARQVRGFLRGLYSANGSIVATRVTLKAASRKVIDGVQQMLSSIGIGSYVTANVAHTVRFSNGDYECRESYDLNIGTRQGRDRFRELIGFIQKYKSDKLAALCDKPKSPNDFKVPKVTFDVLGREDLGEQRVYDITVEADDHVYWTGGLLVSNCAEQPLEDNELCCLGELNPNAHETLEDYLHTIKYAYMYCKAVTLIPTNRPETNRVMTKNRRIGLSMMGVFKMYERLGLYECIRWWNAAYTEVRRWDKTYSAWLGCNESNKVTSVKPGGTVPLLVGEEGGMKVPSAEYFFRTMRAESKMPVVKACIDAGYRVEKDRASPRTSVIYFPVKDPTKMRTADQVSMWEQMELLAALQAHWSDNMVSNTINFQPHEAGQIGKAIQVFAHRIKAVSFLPLSLHGYAQAPYIPITQQEYEAAVAKLKPLDLSAAGHEVDEKYCTGEACAVA